MKAFFGSLLIIGAIYGVHTLIMNANEVELQQQAQFNAIHELTNEEIAKEATVCTQAGLDISLKRTYNNTYESKVVSVSCIPRQVVQQSGGNDLQKAVVTAGAIYVGGKVISHLLK